MNLIWIGKYQSDIYYTNQYINGSITYYGDGLNRNICCCSTYNRDYNKELFIALIIKNIKQWLGKYNYIFYNQSYAYEVINLYPECKEYIININSKELINWLSNKTLVRLWVKNITNVPAFCAVSGNECRYSYLKSLFPRENKFVVQDNLSSGGLGSFIIENDDETSLCMLKPYDVYLVSPLIENSYSINIHMLIGKAEQIIFPMSVQIIEPNKSPFIFRGSDFIIAKTIPQDIVDKLHSYARAISEKLAHMGYRGICGLDFVVQRNEIYFIEINARFQGSSFLIDRVLMEENLPSLYELSERAFRNTSFQVDKEKLENLNIKYSYYKVKCNNTISMQFINQCLNCTDIDIYFFDGSVRKKPTKGYIFRFISKRNIVSINPNNQLNIYQNLLIDQILKFPLVTNEDWTNLKTSLLIQGVKIDTTAMMEFEKLGGVQEGTFDAIDIQFSNGLIVNCPLKIPFIDFSPYTLKYLYGYFELFIYETCIGIVSIDKKDLIPRLKTHSGLPYSKMVQRNNDRIRIRHNSVCVYKQSNVGCYFCHAKNEETYLFDLEDIKESFLFHLKNTKFNKIMIGGASNNREYESKLIKNIIKFVREYTNKSISIMSIPPTDFDEIVEYKKLGANEIAFNIEIFDENIAKKLMPGKGMISRKEYLNALQKATEVFGKSGQVRSMLIIGLESLESFKNGVESLCKIGVAPMISPFRPMQNTRLEYFVPPIFKECQRYIEAALSITQKYNLTLGPLNISNQNNTFNLVNIESAPPN